MCSCDNKCPEKFSESAADGADITESLRASKQSLVAHHR